MTNFEKLKSICQKPQYDLIMNLVGNDTNFLDCIWGVELWYDEFLMSKQFQKMNRETKMKIFQTYRDLQFILNKIDNFEEDNEINGYYNEKKVSL